MRFTHQHDRKNWIANKRIAVIQKVNHTVHTRVQFTNNRLVDKKIIEFEEEIPSEVYDPYTTANIASEIESYNRIATSKQLQRVLNHSIVTKNPQTRLEATKVLNSVADDITLIEAERMVKNLNYVEHALQTASIDIGKYESLISKLPQATSRKEVLERCIITDTPLPANKRLAWLERNLERGASYNKTYSYRELNQLSRDLERYKTNRLDYETAIMENRQANREGYEAVNQTKTWIWSTLENTRHEDLDGETIPLTSKFEVINSQTGDVDYLLYPGDVANDHNNCSNICNCQCSYEIN